MVDELEAGSVHRPRRYRTLSEKRRIAELTFEPGASVAVVARANGVNANQVFKWRRLHALVNLRVARAPYFMVLFRKFLCAAAKC